jgi:hypothetical protein
VSSTNRKITFKDDVKESPSVEPAATAAGIAATKNLLQRKTGKHGKGTNPSSEIGQIVKETLIYFEWNPTYLKDIEVGEVSQMVLRKHVETSGVARNPIFGYPLLNYEATDGSNYDPKKFKECLIGSSTNFLSGKKSYSRLPFGGTDHDLLDLDDEKLLDDNHKS